MGIVEAIVLIIAVILMAVAYALTPSPKKPKEGTQKLEIPTVEEGKVIGIVYGTVEILDPSVVQYWGLKIVPEQVSGGK
jgi:hypothetical protein